MGADDALTTSEVEQVSAGAEAPGLVADDSRVLGQELYRRDCLSCHGEFGEGTARGTPLVGLGAAGVDYVLSTGRMPIARSDDPVRRGPPAYDDAEIAAIVDYIGPIIGGPPVPDVELAGADVGRGGELYRALCAACHSSTGIGGALAFGQLAPPVLESTPVQVAEAIIVGPGTMPVFAAELDDAEMADVAAYVLALQDPPDVGFSVPGGRVGEGLAAWVLGAGLLVAGARWLGTRR